MSSAVREKLEELEQLSVSQQMMVCLTSLDLAKKNMDWAGVDFSISLMKTIALWSALDEADGADEATRQTSMEVILKLAQ